MTQTLSSNKLNRLSSVYRDTLSRYKSVFILYTVVLFVAGPVFVLPEVIEYLVNQDHSFYGLSTEALFHLAALGLACLLPLLLFSYINSRQAVDVYHAMPVTRDKLYWGNVLGGATILLTPYLVLGIPCGVICELMDGGTNGMLSRVCWIALGLLGLYSTMVFIMVNCGTLFESIVYFGIVQIAYPLLIMAVMESLGEFTFGWQEDINAGIPGFLAAFAPGYLLVDVLFGNGAVGWRVVVQSAATTTAALFLGMVLYRRRRSESAGSAFAFKPLFYVGALMVSITAGVGCSLIFDDYGVLTIIISVIVGVLCYFILDTIRNRGLSNAKATALISLGGVIAVGVFYLAALCTGTFGYESRVPAAASVKAVAVQWSTGSESYLSSSFDMTDEANIERVIAAHKAIVENKKAIEDNYAVYGTADEQEPVKDGYIPYSFDDGSGDGWEYGTGNVRIYYTMADGRTVSRRYNSVPLVLTEPLYEAAASGDYRDLQWIGLKEAVESGEMYEAAEWSFGVERPDGWFSTDISTETAVGLAKAMIADLESRPDDWNVHPDSAPFSTVELYPVYYSGNFDLSSYTLNIYERDRNTLLWLKQHGYEVDADQYRSSSGQDIVVGDDAPAPEVTYEYAPEYAPTEADGAYTREVALLLASDRGRLWSDCKMLFHFGGYDRWESNFEKAGRALYPVTLSEKEWDEILSCASSHYISEEPRDVLIVDGNSYLVYPEYSSWLQRQGFTLE